MSARALLARLRDQPRETMYPAWWLIEQLEADETHGLEIDMTVEAARQKSARKSARCRARYKLRRQIDNCARCGASPKRLEVHHKDGDPFNNELENLEVLCVTCHRRHHDRVNGGRPGRRKRFSGAES